MNNPADALKLFTDYHRATAKRRRSRRGELDITPELRLAQGLLNHFLPPAALPQIDYPTAPPSASEAPRKNIRGNRRRPNPAAAEGVRMRRRRPVIIDVETEQ